MNIKTIDKKQIRSARKARIRAKISGTSNRPRLCVFKSNKHIYAQLVDDTKGETLASSSSFDVENKKNSMSDISYEVGKKIAEKADKKSIKNVVFDRGGFQYTGNIDKLASGAREKGLVF